ncbi:MAG: TetR family transcriptional regulator [Xanthomonadales bacterium]|nr:TetR family transcriptional regulator [Xanthomonadales bacterium]
MPKIVDHDLQRVRFAEAAIRLVARDGFEGLTMRAVAAEAGLSYGSLFHYFESKDELLIEAVRHLTGQQTRRVNAHSSRYRGLKALRKLLLDDVLVGEGDRDDAVVWLAFLYRAALQDRFGSMYGELIDGWLERISGLLRDARDAGEVDAGLDEEFEARALWAFSAGLGQQALLHPKLYPLALQKKLIAAYLARL